MAYNQLYANVQNGFTLNGYKQSKEHIAKRMSSTDYKQVSNKLKGRPSPTTGMKLGPPSEETRKKISESNKGKKKNNSDGKMGQYWVGKEKYTFCCIGCQQSVSQSRILRHEKCFNEYTKKE